MSSPNTTQKRYPGVKPFETSERELFFGRDRDIEDLLDLIWLEKLVVLFGKSGYGKSSLINAGILPEIEAEAVPIVVRLGSYLAGQTPAPLDNLRLKINEVLEDKPEGAFLDGLNLPPTLWQQVKRKQSPQQRRFVLIFDQFEEFFTYPLTEQQAFKEQIADLLYTEVPQAVRNQNDTLSASQQAFIASAFDAKVLLAIRADRMSLLDSMKDKLPAILQKRYELKGLSEAQAQEAIVGPAKREGDFASPLFAYSSEALKVMTQKLAASKSSQRSGIEAFQLQILCEYLEDKVIKGEIPGQRVEPQHFAEQIDEIFEGYYQRLLDKLEPGAQEAAQLLIEEKLLFEDANTGEARRLGVDSGVLLAEKGISQALLNQLESNFLLRRESTSTGGFNYEVSHDTLIAPILKSKVERRERERREWEQIEGNRKRRKLLAILAIITLISSICIVVMIYVLNLRDEAYLLRDQAQKSTRSLNLTLKKLKLQQKNTEIQRQKIERQEFLALKAKYEFFVSQGKSLMQQYQYAAALLQFQNALVLIQGYSNILSNKEAINNLEICLYNLKQKNIFESYIAQGDTLLERGPENVLDAIEIYQLAGVMEYNNELVKQKIEKAESEKKSAFLILKDKGLAFANAGRCDYAIRFLSKAIILFYDKEVEEKLFLCLNDQNQK